MSHKMAVVLTQVYTGWEDAVVSEWTEMKSWGPVMWCMWLSCACDVILMTWFMTTGLWRSWGTGGGQTRGGRLLCCYRRGGLCCVWNESSQDATRNYRICICSSMHGHAHTHGYISGASQERPHAQHWLLNQLLLVWTPVQWVIGFRWHTTASLITWLHYCITNNVVLLYPLLYLLLLKG